MLRGEMALDSPRHGVRMTLDSPRHGVQMTLDSPGHKVRMTLDSPGHGVRMTLHSPRHGVQMTLYSLRHGVQMTLDELCAKVSFDGISRWRISPRRKFLTLPTMTRNRLGSHPKIICRLRCITSGTQWNRNIFHR